MSSRVRAALDEAVRESASRWWRRRLLFGTGLAAAAALAVALLATPRDGDLGPLVREYDLAARGELRIAVRTDAPATLERFYAEHAAEGFPSHVVDLSAAGFRLIGGTLVDFPGRRARLSVYSDGRNLIVCDYQFAENFPLSLPPGGGPLFFQRAGVNLCARRMGEEVCVLATRMPMGMFREKVGGWSRQD
jgi:hypothetical protein